MMTIVFLSLAVIIAIVVILVSAKHIKKGFEARSEVKDQQRNEIYRKETGKCRDSRRAEKGIQI